MKLTLHTRLIDVPARCANKYSVYTIGNPFSDAKSAQRIIERITGAHKMIPLRNIAVRIKDTGGRSICVYTVDVP